MDIKGQFFPDGLANYDGKIVIIKSECTAEEVNRLKLDARRVLGLERDKRGLFIDPPEEGSDTWQWAQEIAALEAPVVRIWLGYPKPVSLKDLRPLLVEDKMRADFIQLPLLEGC